MSNKRKHKKVIRMHRRYVRKMCWKMGLFWQGLVHDLSKYSREEMSIAKYYSGTKSPHANCRDILGYSPSWLHHYHINKHHWQFWLDIEDWPDKVTAIKMPYKYVIEMFCDFVGAGKAYSKDKWNQHMPLQYYKEKCEGKRLMHKDSEALLVDLLTRMNDYGEENFLKWYKTNRKRLERNY